MNALELLLGRQSQPRLQSPAPSGKQLDNIKQAALRAPDHAALTPWQFIIAEGDGLSRLGEIFVKSAKHQQLDDSAVARAAEMPHRAPMIIIAATKYTQHDKVPWIEQVESAACAVHAMQMAAFAQGFGGVWRTGPYAQCEVVKSELGIANEDELVGFLYLGSTPLAPRDRPAKRAADYFRQLGS
ncbi:NAD(P)H nitroreductase [Alteromonas oceanisediminis]|uniref:NAD(P)H nitroreductase n=1 Tax=Alteromonas oceanisediminis TaxID=2836180 RepID=UPI001BD9D090|nr:NAD(P)H nitroreductase [Alteromonas oceanisediminis]MBT0586565.1 NAD(P)H nitroreductase [Alteromonas oceanisediminis]